MVRNIGVKGSLAANINETNPVLAAVKEVPVVIVACAGLGKSGYQEGEPAIDKGDRHMFDVGLAMQQMGLAAHALGSAAVHIGRFNAQRVPDILKVLLGYCVIEMTLLGFPEQVRYPRPRKDLSEIVFSDWFGISSK